MKSVLPVKLLLSVALLFFYLNSAVYPCTSILVTKGASKKGACMISYSCDGEFLAHLSMQPAQDHQPGEMLDIYSYMGLKFSIPQVAHTYQVIGLMNEYQLAIGETTFDGRLELENKDGKWDYFSLMEVALQRAKTAREAIQVMVTLVEEYGYGSTGESFSIADKEEAWIMEMIGTGPGGKGAIWVAVRIPDGCVSAHANMSRIREFPLNDPENCLYSKNVISFAVEKGFYDPSKGQQFSFTDAYNPPTEEQVRYSARRVWSIFRRLAPSLNFSPDYSSFVRGAEPYPLYIKPDRKLDVQDVIAMHRDHYEGTEFDMTKDIASGPFEMPDKWRPIKWEVDGQKYAWERPISTQQVSFIFVSESRADIPDEIGGVFWYGFDNPYTNFFVPLYTSISDIPKSYTVGKLNEFSRESAWWAFNFVANWANLRYSYMIKDIQKLQAEIEGKEFADQDSIETNALKLLKENPSALNQTLTKYCVENAETNIQRWWKLADYLVAHYNDGYIQGDRGWAKEVGYPQEWLNNIPKEKLEKYKLHQERSGEGEL